MIASNRNRFRLFSIDPDRFKTREDVEVYAKNLKRKVGRYWNLAVVLIGFMVFALDVNSLAKTTPQIYMAFLEAAITGGIIGYIVKASERAFTALVDMISNRAIDTIKETDKEKRPKTDWVMETMDKLKKKA